MPRPGPRRQNVAVRMSAEQIAALDRAAGVEGVDRSEIVRRAVDAYLGLKTDQLAAYAPQRAQIDEATR